MYFLKQIKTQFLSQITLYDNQSPNENGGWTVVEVTDLNEADRRLWVLEATTKIAGTELEVILRGLERIVKQDPTERQDPEFAALLMRVERLRTILQETRREAGGIDDGLRSLTITPDLAQWIQEVREGITEVQGSGDRTEREYTSEDIPEFQEKVDGGISTFRATFFTTILGELDTGKALSEYISHPKIQALQTQHPEWFEFGYNIEKLLIDFDATKATESQELQDVWADLEYRAVQYDIYNRNLSIIARDSRILEGDTTFGETRLEGTNKAYNTLLEDPKIKEALTSRGGIVPLFEDLNMENINTLREKGVNLAKLFLTDTSAEAITSSILQEGSSYIVNFSANEALQNTLDFAFINNAAQEIEIDGQKALFSQNGISGAGYYDISGRQILLQDGSEVKIISNRVETNPHVGEAIDAALDTRIADLWTVSTQERAFVEAVYWNPESAFEGKTLPGNIVGAILAMLMNIIDGKNFQYNPSTGLWEDMPEGGGAGSPATNGDIVDGYIGNMELGSLSSKYESGSQGSYAYNPDDNGHGPSYGVFQMNTEVGVYRSFIAQHGIAEGQAWWNAAIERIGEQEFHKLELAHIEKHNYIPMMNNLNIPNKENFSMAMKNVIFSISVQHGQWNRRLNSLINNSGVIPGDKNSEAELIKAIYQERWEIYPAGKSSRYNREVIDALEMLNAVNAGDIYNQNLWEIPSGIQSSPAERSPSETPLCSKTARLNLGMLWLTEVHQGSSARDSFQMYPSERISPFPPAWNSTSKVADFYLDASLENAQYGHRVAAFKQGNEWFVLDPYYSIPGYENNRNGPIRAQDYLNHMQGTLGRRLWGAAYFS